MPEVSVIMPIFNGEKFIGEAIQSVLSQSFIDIELICVNDGSTDNSQQIINSFNDPRIISILQKNAGPSKARNTGIKNANGKYIAFLDCDDTWLPFSLEKRLNSLSKFDEYAMVHTDFIVTNETGKIRDNNFIKPKKSLLSGRCFNKLFLEGTNINSCSVIIKSEVIRSIGFFDESFFQAEDYDYWLRISFHYPILFIDDPLVTYRIHDSNTIHKKLSGEIHTANVLIKTYNSFKEIDNYIEKTKINERLYQVCFDAAYSSLLNNELDVGSFWLNKAWIYGRKPKTLILWSMVKIFKTRITQYLEKKRLYNRTIKNNNFE